MNQNNKEAGSDMKFLFWDDPGDSQENVDNQTLLKTQRKNRMRICRTATLASITLSIKTI
jgi:hypothetical protein